RVRLVAAMDERGYYGMESPIFVVPKTEDGLSPYYVLGVLNSRAINFLYAKKFLNVAVKGEYLKSTRIPRPGNAAEGKVAHLVQRIMKARAEGADHEVADLESSLNRHVYSFFGLSDAEKAVIEGMYEGQRSVQRKAGSRKRAKARS